MESHSASETNELRIGLSVVLIVMEVVRIMATLALFIWHIYLHFIGITTYQFLTEQEELQKLKLKLIAKEIT